MEDEPPETVTIDIAAGTAYTFVNAGTQRRCRILVSTDGYTYTRKRQVGETTEWRCAVRNKKGICPVTVRQQGDHFNKNERSHSHQAKPGILKAVQIQSEIKSVAKQDMFESGSSIVDQVLHVHADSRQPGASRPVYNNMVRTANRVRQCERPADPQGELADFEIDTGYLTTSIPEPFYRGEVTVGHNRHFLFATDTQLENLGKAKTWYIDGTFKIVKKPFYQMVSIHAFTRSGDNTKQLPLLFAIMSGKRTKDYTKVFKRVLELLPGEPDVTMFVTDFEAGFWNGLRKVFDKPDIHGCAFHFGQALWRNVQSHNLQKAYEERDSVYKFLRKVFALPFLPPDDIAPAFQKLKTQSTEQTTQFIDYVEKTWIRSATWDVASWSVFGMSIRTNNDVEGYHNRLNRRAKKGNLPFYLMLRLLYNESCIIPTQIKMISEGKLKRQQKKKSRDLHGKIFELWNRYSAKDISVSRLLRQCANIYGPVD